MDTIKNKIRIHITLQTFQLAAIFLSLYIFVSLSSADTGLEKKQGIRTNGILNASERALVQKERSSDGRYNLNVDRTKERLQKIAMEHPYEVTMSDLGVIANERSGDEEEHLYKLHIAPQDGRRSIAPLKVAITTGVHGNEGMSSVALVRIIETVLQNEKLKNNLDLTIYPMINPYGLRVGSRCTRENIDLNRSFRHGHWMPASAIIRDAVAQDGPFDIGLDLHGAGGMNGIFMIKNNEDDNHYACNALATLDPNDVLKSQSGRYPGFCSNRYCKLLSPGETVLYNEGTLKEFLAVSGKASKSYTVEYPCGVPLSKQVSLLSDLVINYLDKAIDSSAK